MTAYRVFVTISIAHGPGLTWGVALNKVRGESGLIFELPVFSVGAKMDILREYIGSSNLIPVRLSMGALRAGAQLASIAQDH